MADAAGVLTATRYAKLVKEIRQLLAQGKARAQEAVAQELVQTYWAIGKRLSEENLTGRANYGESILEDLSEELDVDLGTLQRAIQFFQLYKTAPRGGNLTWAHYKELLPLKDRDERAFYAQETQRLGWTRDQLVSAIAKETFESSDGGKTKKTRTKPLTRPTEPTYVYRADVERVIDGDTVILRVDLGFAVWKEQRIRLAEIDTPTLDEPKG